jgi:uncharacterized protein (AIM24 family)
MAKFEIESSEGTRWVRAILEQESIRARKGNLNRIDGQVTMTWPLPRFMDLWVSLIAKESPWRPRFEGTGEVHLKPSLGGFEVLEATEEDTWIFRDGTFWASEESIKLTLRREKMLTAFWADEGLFWWQTAARGNGKIIIATPGPIEVVELHDEHLVVSSDYVIARTDGIRFTIGRAAKSLIAHWLSGDAPSYHYRGTGKLLVCPVPYWRNRFQQPDAELQIT